MIDWPGPEVRMLSQDFLETEQMPRPRRRSRVKGIVKFVVSVRRCKSIPVKT